MTKYEQLRRDCEKQLCNESRFSLKGIRLTRSDVESIHLYSEYYERGDGANLLKPVGAIKQVLEAYNII